jgi:hypothetical protein
MITRNNTFFSGLAQIQFDIWFSVDSPIPGKYLIYYKLTPPTNPIYGVIIRDDNGQIILFDSVEEAFSYGNRYILDYLIGEE